MAKPLITFRSDTDPYPLTYTELDTNFLNLRDATISVSDSTNTAVLDLNDTLNIVGSGGATVTVNPTTKTLTVSTADTVNAFQTIAVAGQSNVVADATNDTLTLVAGTGITLTTDPTTDSVTIASSGGTLSNVVEDLTPQLGGNLDTNGFNLQTSALTKALTLNYNTVTVNAPSAINPTLSLGTYLSVVGANYGSSVQSSSQNITISASGTGKRVGLISNTGKIVLGNNNNHGITTGSGGDLILDTAEGVNSGSITIADGADQNITIAPNGTGAVVIDGEVDINATITNTPANTSTVVAWLEVGSNGNIYYLPLYQ